jgi:hypothetical protein
MYKFEKLDAKLTEWGFPIIKDGKIFPPLIRKSFKKAYNEGKIEFRNDGIYFIDDNGKAWKGYIYMPKYRVKHFGKLPSFHLRKCNTIEDFINNGLLNGYYEWSNNERNNIIDRDTGQIHEQQILKLCNYCKHSVFNITITDTEIFHQTLGEDIEKDIYGYPINWQKISKQYRISKDYTCESCGIKPINNFDKRFWHTHHLDGQKTNNHLQNLQCLCVLCHSYKDLVHEENFDKTRMKWVLDRFIKKYKTELKRINNSYLNIYQHE